MRNPGPCCYCPRCALVLQPNTISPLLKAWYADVKRRLALADEVEAGQQPPPAKRVNSVWDMGREIAEQVQQRATTSGLQMQADRIDALTESLGAANLRIELLEARLRESTNV